MPSVETVIVFMVGIAHGFVAIPFYIFLVKPVVAEGMFPKKRFKLISIIIVFIALISTYFIIAGLFVGAILETHNYFRKNYYKIWFGSQFLGALLWAFLLGLERNRRE